MNTACSHNIEVIATKFGTIHYFTKSYLHIVGTIIIRVAISSWILTSYPSPKVAELSKCWKMNEMTKQNVI